MRYLFLVFGLLAGAAGFAQQTSTTFSIPDTTADNNTTICLPITVVDFTGGIEFGFSIKFANPEEGGGLTFNRIQNLNPDIDGFGMEDFDLTTYLASGLLLVNWKGYADGADCSTASTETLPDNSVLFEVCFDVSGPIASQHVVRFFNKPDDDPFDNVDDSNPVVFNKRAQCNQGNDAFPGLDNGSVTIGVSPVVLSVVQDEGIYLPGDTYCVDVEAESGFNQLRGYQFGLDFDPTVLRTISVTANTELPQNNDASYEIYDGNSFFGSWNKFGGTPETLLPGTNLVTVCFEVVGECSSRTDIAVAAVNPDGNGTRPLEAIGDGAGLGDIPIITDNTARLIVDNCNPDGFDVVVDCPDQQISFNDTDVCVQIKAGDDFVNMTDIDYLINWDPSILQFDRIDNRNPSLFISVSNHFDLTQTSNGTLTFDWESGTRPSLSPGDVVYEVCFTAVGFGGTSPIVIADFLNDIRSSSAGVFNGVNPRNCAISITKPEGVAVNFPDNIGFSASQDGCFDLEVDGFTSVEAFTLNIFTNNALFSFANFVPAIPGVTASDLGGILQITYNGAPITLPDGGSLGSLCYRAEGTAAPGDCATLGLNSLFASEVFTTESQGNSVPVESLDGEACVLFPNGFGLIIEDTEGFVNDEVCVPVRVTRFTDVTAATIDFNFNPARLDFDRVVFSGPWTGLTGANVDNANAASGQITIDWSTNTSGGLNIADTDTVTVFEICFQAGATDSPCLDITASDGEATPVTTAGGPGSIVYNSGELCLEDRLVLMDIVAFDASCEDNDDGVITFQVEPRPGNEDVFIRTDNPVRFGNNGRVEGLLPGMTSYTIYTATGLSVTGSIMVGVDPESAALAMAGEDQVLSCGENAQAVISSQGNVGETFELFIVQQDGITRSVTEGNVNQNDGNVVTSVDQSGTYILEVTSAAGCTDRDTVQVMGVDQPVAEAGEDLVSIDCTNNGITLTCAGSSTGANVTYRWERINGQGDVLEELGTDCDVFTDRGGRYQLTVTFTDRQCSSTDVIIVRDDRNLPNSSLSDQVALNCAGGETVLSVGEAEDGIAYSWTRLNETTVLGTEASLSVSQLGFYVASLTNPLTSCTRMDTVEVIPSAGVPVITAPDPAPAAALTLPCAPDTLLLVPTFTNVNATTNYLWTTEDGRVVITDVDNAAARVVLPGTYKIVADNGECRDSLSIVVGASELPTVDAGEDAEILCQQTFQLSGSATTSGADVNYQWTRDGLDVPMGAAATVIVDQPGTYYLTATDAISGCSAVDSVVLSAPMGFPAYELADTLGGLGCLGSTLEIAVVNPADDYGYRWADPDGNEISTDSSAVASVSGFYSVTITNPATNCQAVDQVFVDDDAANPPFVAFRQNTLEISCDNGPAVIDAEPSADGENITYLWEAVTGGEEPSTQGNDTLVVRTAGVYRLTLTNTLTGCTASREVSVSDNRDFPNVEAVMGATLDCDTRATTIGVNILDQPNDYSIQWAGPLGITGLPMDTTQISVDVGGTYNAVVINNVTSCVTTVPIRVEDLIDSVATLTIMAPDTFDCNNSSVTIDASETELNNAMADGIVWTSLNGNSVTPPSGSLIVSVNGPGAYELAVTDNTGCTIRDTVQVEAAENTPFAQAGPSLEINCGDMPQLDGSNSSPAPGPGIIYTWSTVDGEILSGGDSPLPFVSGPGTYQLVVTNGNNGCADTSTTVVSLGQQAAAMLPIDFTTCETPVVVEGNLPPGTSGTFTTFNDDGAVFTAEDNRLTITELGNGLSVAWTLSAGAGCENYSSDTTRITPEAAPVANDDRLEVGGQNNVGQIDVKTNDQRTGPVTVTLLDEPGFGEITVNLNGDITFVAPIGVSDITTVRYEICSTVCPTLCDEGTLTLTSSADGEQPEVYNAITPNGDGMNDVFEFRLLELSAAEYPDNELIIFNRWGDILYEASPYMNNWGGTASDGTPVPEGTYYYILRLDIGQGDIIRGDVTVIR